LVAAFLASYYFSHLLRFEFQLAGADLQRFLATVGLVVAIKTVVFVFFRIHQRRGKFVTFYDLLALVQAATVSLLITVLIDRVFLPARMIPRSIFLLDWGTTLIIVGGVQAIGRAIDERSWRLLLPTDKIPTLIVGADESGEALLRSIIRNGLSTYYVIGFMDCAGERLGRRIGGVPVLGTLEQTCQFAQRYGIREVLVTAGSIPGRKLRALVEKGRQQGIVVKVLPSYDQLLRGVVAIRPRPVAIEDLLHREPVELQLEQIRRWIDGRTLLVTGSAGSIGSEICRQLLRFEPARLVAVDRAETGQFFLERELREKATSTELNILLADIRDRSRMEQLLGEFRPHIVFHAAAYKHVPLMELHPAEAVKNILLATRLLADLVAEAEVDSFVMISTDKAVNPTSVMGACKRAAELYIQGLKQKSSCRWVTVRFGNVLDSAGSVVQVFRQQIAAGGPVTITDPRMKRFFMTIPEAAQLVIQAGVIGRSGEILLLDMGEPVSILDLATEMIRLSGLKPGEDIEIQFTGLRPGEKLYEELHTDSETLLPTRHPKIRIADQTRSVRQDFYNCIRHLERITEGDPAEIVEILARAVPEYQPQSPFSRVRRKAA